MVVFTAIQANKSIRVTQARLLQEAETGNSACHRQDRPPALGRYPCLLRHRTDLGGHRSHQRRYPASQENGSRLLKIFVFSHTFLPSRCSTSNPHSPYSIT